MVVISPSSRVALYVVNLRTERIVYAGSMPSGASLQEDGTYVDDEFIESGLLKIIFGFIGDKFVAKKTTVLYYKGNVCIGDYGFYRAGCENGVPATVEAPICAEGTYGSPYTYKIVPLAQCDIKQEESGTDVSSTSPVTLATSDDLSFFDHIITPETVFPDPETRALFKTHPPETSENGRRGYAFSLILPPWVNPKRNFGIVAVTCAPAGTFRQGRGGTVGPGGGFVDFVVRTPDDAYDLRVSLGTLLPNEVDMPEFSPSSTAERLLLRYSQHLKSRVHKTP